MSHDLGTVTYWKNGLHIFQKDQYSLHIEASDNQRDDDDQCFDLEDSKEPDDKYAIHIKVPRSKPGTRALGFIIDLLDDFIDEHFPGLLAIDPILQEPLLKIEIPCPDCQDSCVKQRFLMSEVLLSSESTDEIFCPVHNGNLEIKQLAPDIVLWDLDSFPYFSKEEVALTLTPENLLGDGGFGSVYKACVEEQYVAVKVFKQCGEVHPHKLQRKEASILQLLQHKNIVSLMGILVKPRCIVLELAAYGSMADYLSPESESIKMPIIMKIIKDVSTAMEYLHSKCLIYRDCKPDNVLLFSLSMLADLNAKLSDYGISTMATSVGSFQQEGTPGYRAPECIKGESYSFPIDMFSLGISIFEIITKGKHPYSNCGLRSRAEYDDAVCKGLSFSLISEYNQESWPFMQDLLSQCLQFVPGDRPTAAEFVSQLALPSFFPLQWELSLDGEEYVENIIAVSGSFGRSDLLVVFSKDKNQAGRMRLLDSQSFSVKRTTTKKMNMTVSSMASITSNSVLLGTQDGSLLVSDVSTEQTAMKVK